MSNSVQQLLNRIAGGDEDAFRDLYYLYYDRLLAFACWYIIPAQAAEDVVSDVFFNLWNRRSKLTDILHFETYLYSSVKNGCYNAMNSGYRRKVSRRLEDVNLEVYMDLETPYSKISYENLNQAIEKAVNSLPERCKLIFKMAKEDNLKYKEIGTILDISPRTVENQVAIALKKIEEELQPYLADLVVK